jgi:hypothetical protein
VSAGEHGFTALVSSAAQAYNAELDRARRDGLASDPEPARLGEAALLAARDAGGG